jgi:hypothetical protein
MLFIQANPIGDALNNTEWAFPMAECFHIDAFAFSIGTIMLVDLRLLGVGFRRQSAAQLVKDTSPWTIVGLTVVLIAGMALFLSDPVMYYRNASFRFKVTIFVLAVIYNYTIHRKVAQSDFSPAVGMLVGIVSIALWVSIVAGGIFIAFV